MHSAESRRWVVIGAIVAAAVSASRFEWARVRPDEAILYIIGASIAGGGIGYVVGYALWQHRNK